MNDYDLLITNAYAWCNHEFQTCNVAVKDGKICKVFPSEDNAILPGADEVTDATGCWLLPGLCDIHVHFRQPGQEYKETILSGSRAAAAGGFTTVCTMPNLNPAPDGVETLQSQLDIIARDACIEVIPYATITEKRAGHKPIDYTSVAAEVAGFSDDGSGIQDESVMCECMQRAATAGRMLAAHCEVNDLLDGGYIHKGDYAAAHGHRGICSQSEWQEVERDIRLAESTGCPLHICHISCKESVNLIRDAKNRGVDVSCETAPHYLAFTQDNLQEDARWKMNPPLRDVSDRDALLKGLADGTIDAVATDHAPHGKEEKAAGLEKSAMGVVGLETSIAAVYTYAVLPGIITPERMMELMCDNPRRLIHRPLSIAPGEPADFILFDPGIKWIVNPEKFLSKGKATPFAGLTLTGKVTHTFFRGNQVFPQRQ